METLPSEILLHIFSFLSPRELLSCFKVSHRWRQVANSDSLWRDVCMDEYINDIFNKRQKLYSRMFPMWHQFTKLDEFRLKSSNRHFLKKFNLPTRETSNLEPLNPSAVLFWESARTLSRWIYDTPQLIEHKFRPTDRSYEWKSDGQTLVIVNNNTLDVYDLTTPTISQVQFNFKFNGFHQVQVLGDFLFATDLKGFYFYQRQDMSFILHSSWTFDTLMGLYQKPSPECNDIICYAHATDDYLYLNFIGHKSLHVWCLKTLKFIKEIPFQEEEDLFFGKASICIQGEDGELTVYNGRHEMTVHLPFPPLSFESNCHLCVFFCYSKHAINFLCVYDSMGNFVCQKTIIGSFTYRIKLAILGDWGVGYLEVFGRDNMKYIIRDVRHGTRDIILKEEVPFAILINPRFLAYSSYESVCFYDLKGRRLIYRRKVMRGFWAHVFGIGCIIFGSNDCLKILRYRDYNFT